MEMMSCVFTLIYICRRLYLKCIIRVSVLHVLMSFKNDAIRGEKRSLALVFWIDDWMVHKFPISFEPTLKKKTKNGGIVKMELNGSNIEFLLRS